MTLCPRCHHDWPRDCESAISTEILGACIWCRREELTDADLQAIRDEYRRRKATFEHLKTLP